MAVTTEHIRSTLAAYLERYPEDKADLAVAVELAGGADADGGGSGGGVDVGSRKEFRGHATAGAVLVGADGLVLHVLHVATGKWLLPGGHLEPEDVDLAGAALRELAEETGVSPGAVTLVDDRPMHIDVHPIPANDAKGEPAHRHVDFRFLFRTDAEVGELQVEEVAGAAWRPVDALHDPRLRRRVVQALR